MSEINVCENCIVLPICKSRCLSDVMIACSIFDDLIQQEGDTLDLYDEKLFYFVGLERSVLVRRGIKVGDGKPVEQTMVMDYDKLL